MKQDIVRRDNDPASATILRPDSLTSRSSVVLPRPAKVLPTVVEPRRSPNRPDAAIAGGPDEWRQSMRSAFRTAAELRQFLSLPQPVGDSDFNFPVFVPQEFAAKMRPGDPNDPLLRQVLPVDAEGVQVDGFGDDPVGDLGANVASGVLHKYAGRALVITTGTCGVHCRYCFRRNFPYSEAGSRAEQYAPTIDYLRSRADIDEVILSGGDPLTMTDVDLSRLIERIETVGHVSRLRIHSRMPIVIPSRVTDMLTERLRDSRLTAWMVVHVNHAAELDTSVRDALGRLIDAGIPVLNQAVLLRGVNDDVDTLESLSKRLLECRVIPYYLHQLDRVAGAAHFEVPVDRGLELIDQLNRRLPGFAVPKYVREIAGEASKTPLG